MLLRASSSTRKANEMLLLMQILNKAFLRMMLMAKWKRNGSDFRWVRELLLRLKILMPPVSWTYTRQTLREISLHLRTCGLTFRYLRKKLVRSETVEPKPKASTVSLSG